MRSILGGGTGTKCTIRGRAINLAREVIEVVTKGENYYFPIAAELQPYFSGRAVPAPGNASLHGHQLLSELLHLNILAAATIAPAGIPHYQKHMRTPS